MPASKDRFVSKTLPTDPWSIPQTPNQQFMKEFLSFGGERGCLGYAPGVCWVSLRLLIRIQESNQIRSLVPGML